MSRSGVSLPIGRVAAAVACLLGVAGLVRGLVPSDPSGAGPTQAAVPVPADAVVTGDIAVYGAYLREPASPDTAAAYLTMVNVGDQDDRLIEVASGASRSASIHDVPTGAEPTPNPTGGASVGMDETGDVTLSPGKKITLSPGNGHIMLEGLTGTLAAGQQVSLLLTFDRAGQVLLQVPVIGIGAPVPAEAEGEG